MAESYAHLAVRSARRRPIDHALRVVDEDSGVSSEHVRQAAAAQQSLVEDMVRHDEKDRVIVIKHRAGRENVRCMSALP